MKYFLVLIFLLGCNVQYQQMNACSTMCSINGKGVQSFYEDDAGLPVCICK